MSENKENQLLDLVNLSGYPLQIGIEERVNQSYQDHKWSIVGREHYWINPASGDEGFIDLILARNNVRMAVECKRVLDRDWIFLVTNLKEFRVSKTKFLCSLIQPTDSDYGWYDVDHTPESFGSPFCIMGREKERSTLENLSGDLLMALESLALEERTIMLSHTMITPVKVLYVPVIVTTAELHICSFQPDSVNIEDGKVSPESEFQKVDFVRFRKGLSTANFDRRKLQSVQDLREANKANERTVFIIQASKFVNFLCRFED